MSAPVRPLMVPFTTPLSMTVTVSATSRFSTRVQSPSGTGSGLPSRSLISRMATGLQ